MMHRLLIIICFFCHYLSAQKIDSIKTYYLEWTVETSVAIQKTETIKLMSEYQIVCKRRQIYEEVQKEVKTLGLLEQQLLGIDARALCEFYSMGKVVDYFMIDNYYRVLHKEKYYQANEKLIKLLLLPSSPYGGKLVNTK